MMNMIVLSGGFGVLGVGGLLRTAGLFKLSSVGRIRWLGRMRWVGLFGATGALKEPLHLGQVTRSPL